MKILIASTFQSSGGAAKASSRLFSAIKDHVDTQYAFLDFLFLRPYLDQMVIRINEQRPDRFFSYSDLPTNSISKLVKKNRPDVLNLHWVQSGFLSLSELQEISCPIVWTLHDSWVFTGGCHIPLECEKHKTGCGFCPALNSSREEDLSRKTFNKKKLLFNQRKDIFVMPSKWLFDQASQSELLKDQSKTIIKNIIPTKIFKIQDKYQARYRLGLPFDKKILTFGAKDGFYEKNKGFDLLKEAAQISSSNDLFFVFYGMSEPKDFTFKFPYLFLGEINDDELMASIFNSADLVCLPSRSENSSNTIIEAQSCGTPVIAFDVGGNGELINHLDNGYLARPYDIKDFSQGFTENFSQIVKSNIFPDPATEYLNLFKNIQN